MRPAYTLHNPFINRFNDPVTRRLDEMQCDEYVAWLRERNQTGRARQSKSAEVAKASVRFGRLVVSVCGLLVLLVSITAFIKAL
jgi:hypothetical protein